MRERRARLIGPIVTVLAALVISTSPALAATNNVYRSQFNGSETAGGSFRTVSGIAVNASGDVYVVDEEHQVVDEFSPSGSGPPLAEFKASETVEGSFSSENSVAVSPSGDVYVVNGEHDAIDEFNPSGTAVLHEFNGSQTAGESFYLEAIAVNASGDVYIADGAHEVVDEFVPSGAEVLAEFSGSETEAGSFRPGAIAVAPSGDVYIVDGSHDVVDEFNSAGTGKPLAELKGSETPQASFEPSRVAVSSNGGVYVLDASHHVVDEFNTSGAYESQFEGGATSPAELQGYGGIAIAPSGEVYLTAHEVVYLFSEPVVVPTVTTGPASNVNETTATVTGSINPAAGQEAACEFRYGTTSSYGETAMCVPAGPFSSLTEVSAELTGLAPGTTYHYRLEGSTASGTTPGVDQSFTTPTKPVPKPTVAIKPASAITKSSANFNGEVDPNEAETTYHFEDSTDGTHWSALEQGSAGNGANEVPVSETVTGLTGNTSYHVRLIAINAGGSTVSAEATFAIPASAPEVFGSVASQMTASQVTLSAVIYPENEPAAYQFQYGTTLGYGSSAPAYTSEEVDTPRKVSQRITGLDPGTVYHYRVLATNATGTTTTADQTFITPAAGEGEPAPEGSSCPNEALRGEGNVNPGTGTSYSDQLDECRAYEQVTPPFKNAALIGPVSAGFSFSGVSAIATSGDSVELISPNVLGTPGGDNAGALEDAVYGIVRGMSAWATASLNPESSRFPRAELLLSSPTNPAAGIWATDTPSQSENVEDLSLREGDGAFTEIGPVAPASATAGPPRDSNPDRGSVLKKASYGVDGVSEDLSTVLFTITSPSGSEKSLLWPGDTTVAGAHPSLYEYVGNGHSGQGSNVPSLAAVDNGGTQLSQCGSSLGGGYVSSDEPGTLRNAVSASGKTIFFTAQAGGCAPSASGPVTDQVYARVGAPGEAQTAINVAGTSECASSISCNVTSPVTYQGASKDGSSVFFTTTQRLLPNDKDATSDLYECDVSGDDGIGSPAPTGLVDACPNLKAVSVTGTTNGADVQSVVAISENGTKAYFTAAGLLTSVANSQGRTAQVGQDNLYAWEAPSEGSQGGRTTFIATLTEPTPSEVQATPDGDYLVFTSTADLTLDDTSTAAQAFRYDAETGELARISTGQGGFNNDGNTDIYSATLAPQGTVSDDGADVVFQTNDALTAQVHGGLHNVYEWHDGTVDLISAGSDTSQFAGLVGIDASGANIFFTTADQLVRQDTDDDVDLYDARVDGGYPAPTPEASCGGEACEGTSSGSGFSPPSLASTKSPAIGNLAAPEKTTTKPSKVTITKHSVKGPTITLSVSVSGPGKITASGSGLRSVKKVATKAGTYTLKVTLTEAEKASLRKHHKLKRNLKVFFTPGSGSASSTTVALTLKT